MRLYRNVHSYICFLDSVGFAGVTLNLDLFRGVTSALKNITIISVFLLTTIIFQDG